MGPGGRWRCGLYHSGLICVSLILHLLNSGYGPEKTHCCWLCSPRGHEANTLLSVEYPCMPMRAHQCPASIEYSRGHLGTIVPLGMEVPKIALQTGYGASGRSTGLEQGSFGLCPIVEGEGRNLGYRRQAGKSAPNAFALQVVQLPRPTVSSVPNSDAHISSLIRISTRRENQTIGGRQE